MNSGITILTTLKRRYRLLRTTELILFSLAAGIMGWCFALLFDGSTAVQLSVAIGLSVCTALTYFFSLKPHIVTEQHIAGYLNTHYTQLHGSTDLLLADRAALTPLLQLQQHKTLRSLNNTFSVIQFPNRIKTNAVICTVALIALISIYYFNIKLTETQTQQILENTPIHKTFIKQLPSEIKSAQLIITPPGYTSLKKYAANDFNITVPEGSDVLWQLVLTQPVKRVVFISSSHDSISLKQSNDGWSLTNTITKNGFYQLAWYDSVWRSSEFYKTEIVPDQPPVIKLSGINQFTELAFDSKQEIDVNPLLTDDYGLTDAYIIATVSKGSGESVKFREEKLNFVTPNGIHGKTQQLKRTINLQQMGMEPGDELYFYIEAFDNKTPVANRTRTETYFVMLQDTAQDVMVSDGGLGVDLMPEYFRSQRQIIIDTEKLITEQKSISKKDFAFKSNELGYDQKVLRLRYGQFMGEEFESGIGPAEHIAPEDDHDHDHDHEESHEKKIENLAKSFGHQHDTENEHNLVDQKKNALTHNHAHDNNNDPDKKENLMDAFMHNHDNEESATFFFESIKLKLKAALTQMWDAELYLRLYEPQKSLPYQYTALKLLKEISNDSRIYVHRTGFDPPPIKEEKRLSADLQDIRNTVYAYEAIVKKHYPDLYAALQVTEALLSNPDPKLTEQHKRILLQSGNELAAAALENPALLEGLSALQGITTQEHGALQQHLIVLRSAYWRALPKQPATATQKSKSLHAFDQEFIRQLQLEP